MTTILVQAIQRRILWFSVLAVLLTGVVVALSIIVPLAGVLRAGAEERLHHLGTVKALALAATAERQIEVTRQITSRTAIRDALEAHNRGEMPLEDVQAFTAPRLTDAMAGDAHVVGITRLGLDGTVLVAVGEAVPPPLLAPLAEGSAHAGAPPVILGPVETAPDVWRVAVSAVIRGRDGERAGSDIALFDPAGLLQHLRDDHLLTFLAAPDTPRASGQWAGAGADGALRTATLPTGPEWRVSLHTVEPTGWQVAVALPAQALFAGADAAVMRAGLAVAALLAGAVGILLLLLRPLAGHMLITTQQLQDQVQELSELRRDLETERRQLADSNAELEQFAYAASHDMRQPLRMVIGFLDLLQRRAAPVLDGESRSFIQEAKDGAMRLNGMIEGLLEYSRVGRLEGGFAPVDLHGAVARAEANLAALVADTGGDISYGPLPTVMAEPGQMLRLFQNLLENALKYRSPDRPPHITVTATPGPGDGQWTLRVADNGRGMNPAEAPRAFGLFQRLTSDHASGTIALETREGVGTTVVLTLPAAAPNGAAPNGATPAAEREKALA